MVNAAIYDKSKIVAVIPARGGSKRIPHKNIVDFCGKPLIAWTIEAALESKLFDKVIVSTDDSSIAHVAENFGAIVPFLRDKYNDDFSQSSDVTIYVLNELQKKLNLKYDIVFQLMATCPLRNASDIQKSFDNFIEKKTDFQISCFKFGWMRPWWANSVDDQQKPCPLFSEALKKRSQDLPELYCPTGAVWLASVDRLLTCGSFYGDFHIFYPLSLNSAIDIDDYADLEMARVFKLIRDKEKL